MNHKGSEGCVKIGANTIAEVKNWNMEESVNIIDDTELKDDWKTKKSGTKEWKGSLECFWDESDTNGQGALILGAEVTLDLYPEGDATGDTYFQGQAIVSNINKSAGVDGMVEASFSFEGNGALAEQTVA